MQRMLNFNYFDNYNGLTLGQMIEPSIHSYDYNASKMHDRIQLDPDQFDLASFDINAFMEHYFSLQKSWYQSLPRIEDPKLPFELERASKFYLSSLTTGK